MLHILAPLRSETVVGDLGDFGHVCFDEHQGASGVGGDLKLLGVYKVVPLENWCVILAPLVHPRAVERRGVRFEDRAGHFAGVVWDKE